MVVAVIIRVDTTVTVIGTDAIPVFAITNPAFCPVEQVVANFSSKTGNDQVLCIHRATEPFETVIRAFVNLHIFYNGTITDTKKRKSVKLLFTVISEAGVLDAQVFNGAGVVHRGRPPELGRESCRESVGREG